MNDLSFLEFTINPSRRQVCRGSAGVPIGGKAFDLLLYMVRNAGRPLLKEELLAGVWPDSIVEESNLTYNVYQIRKALAGSGAISADAIVTLPGRGYQFTAVVTPIAEPALTVEIRPSQGDTVPGIPARKLSAGTLKNGTARIRLGIGVATGATVCAILLTVYLPSDRHVTVIRSVRLTNDGVAKHLNEVPPVLVEAEGKLIFIEKADNRSRIAEIPIDGGEVQTRPAPFSTSAIASYSDVTKELLLGSIWKTNDDQPIVGETSGNLDRQVGELTGHDASWSRDGRHVAVARSRFLYVAEADGANLRRIASTDGILYFPRWSPDGKVIRFTENMGTGGERIWQVNADGSDLHRFLEDREGIDLCCGTWSADGRRYFYLNRGPSFSSIWMVPDATKDSFVSRWLGTGKPVQLTTGMTDLWQPPLPSRDGQVLWTIGSHPRGELVRIDPKTRDYQSYLNGLPAEGVSFSADGVWMAYTSYPDGTLWRSKADGSGKLKLSASLTLARYPRWSPDGQTIAFFATSGSTQSAIYLVAASGGTPQRMLEEEASEGTPSWSPDGKFICFGRLIDYGTERNPNLTIEVYDLDRHSRTTLHGSQGLWTPRWSPDGRFISAVTQDNRTLRLYDTKTRDWVDLASIGVNDATWSPDSQSLYFDTFFGNDAAIYRIAISTRKLDRWMDLRGFPRGGFYGPWLGMGKDGAPMILRDTSIEEVYRLDLDNKR